MMARCWRFRVSRGHHPFPDDARPARWTQPVLALGNFDGLHRGHRKILDRAAARRPRARRHVRRHDVRPASAAGRAARQGAAAADDQGAEARRRWRRPGVDGAAIVRFTHELSQWDPETFVRTVLVEWLRVSEVWVGANFLFGHDRSGNFSLLRTLGARYGFKAEKIDPVRYKDFVVSSTRIRRLVSEARVDEASALLGPRVLHRRHGGARRRSAAARSDFRPRTSAPTTSCVPPHGVYATTAIIDGIVLAVGHQHRDAADRRRVGPDVDRDAHLRLRSRSLRDDAAPGVRPAAARRAGVRVAGRAESADRRRLRAAPACCSIAFRCRIALRGRPDDFAFALTLPGHAHDTRDADRRAADRARATPGYAGDDARAARQAGERRPGRGVAGAAVQPCGSRRTAASCRSSCRRPGATGARRARAASLTFRRIA